MNQYRRKRWRKAANILLPVRHLRYDYETSRHVLLLFILTQALHHWSLGYRLGTFFYSGQPHLGRDRRLHDVSVSLSRLSEQLLSYTYAYTLWVPYIIIYPGNTQTLIRFGLCISKVCPGGIRCATKVSVRHGKSLYTFRVNFGVTFSARGAALVSYTLAG